MTYTVRYTPDEEDPNIINVDVPAIPGCHTYGFGMQHARKMAKEVIELCVEDMREHGEPLPPSEISEQVEVSA